MPSIVIFILHSKTRILWNTRGLPRSNTAMWRAELHQPVSGIHNYQRNAVHAERHVWHQSTPFGLQFKLGMLQNRRPATVVSSMLILLTRNVPNRFRNGWIEVQTLAQVGDLFIGYLRLAFLFQFKILIVACQHQSNSASSVGITFENCAMLMIVMVGSSCIQVQCISKIIIMACPCTQSLFKLQFETLVIRSLPYHLHVRAITYVLVRQLSAVCCVLCAVCWADLDSDDCHCNFDSNERHCA